MKYTSERECYTTIYPNFTNMLLSSVPFSLLQILGSPAVKLQRGQETDANINYKHLKILLCLLRWYIYLQI